VTWILSQKDVMYLSKFYLYKFERGNGYAHEMLEFVIKNAKELKLNGIVNNYMLLGIRRRT